MATAPRCRTLRLEKAGNAPDEYEDASAADPARGRFAVADGATAASFAGLWARLLAEGCVAARAPWRESGWLADARGRWAAEVDGRPLPWYAEAKREEGAFATLIGVAVRRGREPSWRALAVGDSCVFHVRGGRLRRSFPLDHSAAFDSHPPLLGSRGGATPARRVKGRWRPGDVLFLATDALAQWFLARHEADARPADELGRLLDAPEGFAGWAAAERDAGRLRNDDLTLVAIDL